MANTKKQFIIVDFTDTVGDTMALCKKYGEIWKTGYGFVKYIDIENKHLMLLERGADYSDMNL